MIHKVGAIIAKDGHILVVKKRGRHRDAYIIPGGRSEPGEAPLETLRRELCEELSVVLEDAIYVGQHEDEAAFENDRVRIDVYDVKIAGVPRAASEIKEIRWINKNYAASGVRVGSILAKHIIPELVLQGRLG